MLDSFTIHHASTNQTADSSVMSPITEAPPTPLTPPALPKMDSRTDLIADLPTFNGGEDIGKENPCVFITKWKEHQRGSGLTNSLEMLARVIVAKTAAEKQDDLRQHMLLEKDLLQKQELTDGREAYSHIVWAEKALQLARLIPNTNHLLVFQSKAQLPEALHDYLADDCDTWEMFTEVVKDVKLTKLREKIKRKEEGDRLKKVESLESTSCQPQMLSKVLANMLSCFSLSTPVPQSNFGAPHQTQHAHNTYRSGRSEVEKWGMIL
ncbi:hypothetical protein H0H87_007335 [Tephrocybe sp. NHM501043]|nr:hypothetical protein H0H87_007335 [Tephrocybe sp. NHM501043]